jgi:hypothetical protein
MSITVNSAALEAALLKLERAADTLPQIAAQVQQETLGFIVLAARRNIYDTQAGAYRRTQDLLRGLDARFRVSANSISITVSGNAPYHRDVELGSGATEISPQQAQAYARANPNPAAPLYFGRSGVNYNLPGPIVAPGQAFAFFRLKQLFAEAVRRV